MNWEMFAGILRHAATYVAGILTANGVFDPSQGETIVGLIMGVGGLIWSILAKKFGWGATPTAVLAMFTVGGGALAFHTLANDNGILRLVA